MQFSWSSLSSSKSSSLVAHLAFNGFEGELIAELAFANVPVLFSQNRLVIAELSTRPVWAQLSFSSFEIFEFTSIGDAVKKLKSSGKWWASESLTQHRRAELIQSQLPQYKISPLDFLGRVSTEPMGFWSLLEKNRILMAARTESPFPLGEVTFSENKTIPPSRAYLKLWELFTLHLQTPRAQSRVIDFGSCPGGWTWVLQSLGCQVMSIDKAPLAPQISSLPGVNFLKKDAFTLTPQDLGPVDWFFSDIICYPPRLYELIQEWRGSGLCKRFVCTLKFQKETDFAITQKFLQIPGSRVIHLCHNKHEVTWVLDETKTSKALV